MFIMDLLEIPSDKLIEKIQLETKLLSDFLFCILAIFRYSAGLNFRANIRLDDLKLKYLQLIYNKLEELRDKLIEEKEEKIRAYTKRDYIGLGSIEAMIELENEKVIPKDRKEFDKFLAKFRHEVTDNNYFNKNYIPTILESPSICMLTKTDRITRIDLLIDELCDSQLNIIGRHCCCRKNAITLIPRNIFSFLMFSLAKYSKKISKYLTCIEYDMGSILMPKIKLLDKSRKILYDFFKKISAVALKDNLIFVIENAELLDESFYLDLKYCKDVIPHYIKIILTVNLTIIDDDKLKMLNSQNIHINHGKYMPRLCQYYIKSTLKESNKNLIDELIKCTNNNIESFKAYWKQLKKLEPSVDSFKDYISKMTPPLLAIEKKSTKIRTIAKLIKTHKDCEILEKIIIILRTTRSPLTILILEDLIPNQSIKEVLQDFLNIFYLSDIEIALDSTICLKHQRSWQQYWKPSTQNLHSTGIVEKCWSLLDNDSSLEIPEYYRLNAVHQYIVASKIIPTPLSSVRFLYPDWIFSQIVYFKSFDFVYSEIDALHILYSDSELVILKNLFHLLEQTYEGAELPFSDFAAHMHSRLMMEESLLFQNFLGKLNDSNYTYFKPMFSSLKENNNFEFITGSDSEIAAITIDKKMLTWGTSLGMVYIASMPSFIIQAKIYMKNGVQSLKSIFNGKIGRAHV